MTRAECERGTRVTATLARLVVALALATVWLAACETQTTDRDITMIDPQGAIKAMNGRTGVLGLGKTKAAWVDPRSLEAYRKGHIPGAIHLPFADVADDHEFLLEGVTTIVVYGDDYNDVKAKGMSKRLIELGYKDVMTLTGGLRQWTAQGHELETGDPARTATASQ